MRVGELLPQPRMAQDTFYDVGSVNEADDSPFVAALNCKDSSPPY